MHVHLHIWVQVQLLGEIRTATHPRMRSAAPFRMFFFWSIFPYMLNRYSPTPVAQPQKIWITYSAWCTLYMAWIRTSGWMYSQNRLNMNRILYSVPRFTYSTCRHLFREQSHPEAIFINQKTRSRDITALKLGLYTILPLPILHGVWHIQGESGGGRILRISLAMVLQECGHCRWSGNTRMINSRSQKL